MHFIQLCEQCSEMLLWVDEKVGKVGESFSTFIIETPCLKTTFRNKTYDKMLKVENPKKVGKVTPFSVISG